MRLFLGLVFCTSLAFASEKVIYGDDNRVDVIDSTNSLYVELAKSTAAMIATSSVRTEANEMVRIMGQKLSERGICASERFADQLSAANCSGFLVGEDLLVTAGHCIRDMNSCNSYSWVFDFKQEAGQNTNMLPKNNVYRCKEIVERELSQMSQDDYALIRLDRKVTDRAPLSFRKEGKIAQNAPIVVIGHPSGLPTKIADGANVRTLANKYFSANLDTYGGNSGSAVFDANTGLVEGILVRGATDYVAGPNGCRISNVVSNTAGRGEDVTYITNIRYLKNL
jgi:V8-like Glu-specific endopeptidase